MGAEHHDRRNGTGEDLLHASRRRDACPNRDGGDVSRPASMPTGTLSARKVLSLQRTAGNRVVAELLGRAAPLPSIPPVRAGPMVVQRAGITKQAALTSAFTFDCSSIKGSRLGDDVVDAIVAKAADLLSVATDVNRLKMLIGFAEAEMVDASGVAARLDTLIRYNKWATKTQVGFKQKVADVNQVMDWAANVTGPAKDGIDKYAKDVSVDSLMEVAKSEDDVKAIGNIISAGGGIFSVYVNKNTLARLKSALAAFGPGSNNVPTFTAWGQGAESDAEVNKKVHFEKHVLRLGNAKNPEPSEPLLWKAALSLPITKTKMVDLGANEGEVRPYFNADGTDFVDATAGKNFYNDYLPTRPALVTALRTAFGDTYYAAVLATAGSLSRVVIAADTATVKILGYGKIGGCDLFVAGRFDAAGTAATVSSGYLTLDDQLTSKNVGSIGWFAKGS